MYFFFIVQKFYILPYTALQTAFAFISRFLSHLFSIPFGALSLSLSVSLHVFVFRRSSLVSFFFPFFPFLIWFDPSFVNLFITSNYWSFPPFECKLEETIILGQISNQIKCCDQRVLIYRTFTVCIPSLNRSMLVEKLNNQL